MMLVSTISYVDRNTLALLSPTILRETHLNNEQYGYIILAFSIAYMVGNPLWGRILDRVGVRTGMLASVSLWTVASVGHVFASGLRSFAAARAVLGFGEGATFPGGLRTVVQSLPAGQRSRGIAIAYSGGSLGALITPIIITPIASRWGWHGAFWFTGAIGAIWLAMWAVLSRRPALRDPIPVVSQAGSTAPNWTDARLWAFIAAYALGAFPSGFVLYQAANYFSAAMHKSQVEIGYVLWIPPLGWEIGYFFWGWAIDRFAGGGTSTVAMRRLFAGAMLLSLPLGMLARVESFGAALAIMFLAMFIAAAFIIGAVAYVTSHYSTTHSGLIAGVGAGSWSAVIGGVMPMMGRLFDRHDYNSAFEITALFPVLGYALWRMLDRRAAACP
jgi:ACS family hexuronate transporter-like MFS transporter